MTFNEIKDLAVIIGIILSVLGLFLNFYTLLRNLKQKKLTTYLDITKAHRELWTLTILHPDKFGRILKKTPNLKEKSITYEEERFVQLVLLHISVVHNFSKSSEITKIEQLKYDVDDFLSLPIPNLVWIKFKHFFNKEFVLFVDASSQKKWYHFFKHQPMEKNNKSWKILILTAFPQKIAHIFQNIFFDELIFIDDKSSDLTKEFILKKEIDFIVVFGYGKILSADILELIPAINVHGGYLPYNKGPNPNLWAWLDNTPKGVSIHYIDKGIDTGDIIEQKLVHISDNVSLQESFDIILVECVNLLENTWPLIRSGKNKRTKQNKKGTKHTFKMQESFKHLFTESNMNLPINDFCSLVKIELNKDTN